MEYPAIFKPLRIKHLVFKNRIWSAPAGVHLLQGREPYPSTKSLAYYVNKAKGGCAVITYSAQNMDIEAPYDAIHGQENILNPESHRFFSEFTSAIHAEGAKVSLELLAFGYHHVLENGERVLLSVNGSKESLAFTQEDFERIAKSYGEAAKAALACGFDMLLIHGGHGLCLSQFYSKQINKRMDGYGADSLENKMRFVDMILDEIRKQVGDRLLIEFRISGEEDPKHHEGYNIEDCIEMVKHIQDKIDIVHVSTGAFYNGTENITHPTEFLPHGCNVSYAAKVKACKDIHIPVLTLGAIQNAKEAEVILENGEADIVAMARGLIADAYRVRKWQEGKEDDAIPCIRCFHCLDYGRAPYFACSVNPEVGRETLLPLLHRETDKKKVVVVGGGPSGMQAAISAKQEGHEVILLEQGEKLGGKLRFSEGVPFKQDLYAFMHYQIHQVEKWGIKVFLKTKATSKVLNELQGDALILALGSKAKIPPIKGIEKPKVIFAEEAYKQADSLQKETIVVLGGGLVGCETGLYLAKEKGCNVTILELQEKIAMEEMHLTRDALWDQLETYTHVRTKAPCLSIDDEGLSYEQNGQIHHLKADHIVVACGMKPCSEEADALQGLAKTTILVGDCLQASNVRHALRTGYDVRFQL